MPGSFATLPTELRQKIFLDTLSGFPRYHLPDRGLSAYIEATIGLKRSARAAKPSSAQKRHYTTEQPAKEPDMSALEHQIYCLAFIDDRAAEEMSIVLWLHLKRIYEPAREWCAQQREKMVFWVNYIVALHPADPRTRAIHGAMQNQINRLAATADEMTSHKNCMERMLRQLQRRDIDDWPGLIGVARAVVYEYADWERGSVRSGKNDLVRSGSCNMPDDEMRSGENGGYKGQSRGAAKPTEWKREPVVTMCFKALPKHARYKTVRIHNLFIVLGTRGVGDLLMPTPQHLASIRDDKMRPMTIMPRPLVSHM